MAMANFTEKTIAGLKLADGRKDQFFFDETCRGLGLRITAAGAKIFLVQWTDPSTKAKVREKLGPWGSLTVEQARVAARARLGQVARGVDVVGERRQRKEKAEADRREAALTLDALVTEWAALHLASRRASYSREAQRAIRLVFADFLNRPAAKLTRTDAVNVLDRLVRDGKAPTAARTMAYARAAYSWALKRGKIPTNPFQGLPIATASQSRDRVLTDLELAGVWAAAGALPYPFGPFFQMATLTLQRRDEVAGMRWSEISDDFDTWRIPGSRMKNAKPHDVHLSGPAREILRALPRVEDNDFVFTTTGKTPISGFSKAKLMLDAAIEKARAGAAAGNGNKAPAPEPWRLHDLRRTGVSTLARLGFDSIVVDKLLAHQPAKLAGVAAVYQRHGFEKERAAALEAWATHVVQRGGGSNVVSLRGGR
jgi:integrase